MVSAAIETIQAICSTEELAPLVSNISFPAEYNFQNRLMAELLALDIKEGVHGLTHEEQILRESHKAELIRLAHLAEISKHQKSRVLWLKEGDNNTKFFHKMANSHRRYNYMENLEVDGVVYEEIQDIRNQAVHFYELLYQENEGWRPKLISYLWTLLGRWTRLC
jgi:hypothetical protein